MSEYIIEMKGISKSFPGTKALDCVDFSVYPGEIHALLGENGAGKSTLMNILSGHAMMDTGQILMNQKPIQIASPKDAFRLNIVLVPQELNLVPNASVAENIFLGNECKRSLWIDWRKTEKKAAALLKIFDLAIDPREKVKNLSAAYQQLVSIARAMTYAPKALILDEPTAVLTHIEAQTLFASMQKLKNSGASIIFITHHLDEVLSESDRLTIMRDGRLIQVAKVADMTKERIINLMAGRTVQKIQRTSRTKSNEVFFEAKELKRQGVFQDISFQLHKGEILCVAGLIGSGRTEIFQTIFGICAKDPGGRIYIEGKKADIHKPLDAIQFGIGYVSEERRHDGIIPGMSVMENIMLLSYGQIKKNGFINFSVAAHTTDTYIHQFKIKAANQNVPIKNLSGGNQQKAIVARWVAKGVKMLILDEPTRGVDVNAKEQIHQLIRELADAGVSIVVISSESEEILALADRVMVVHQGRIKGYLEDLRAACEEDLLKIAFA